MKRECFVAAARSYVGTPFHHQGRIPCVGLDCAGVIVCAAAACGYAISDDLSYGRIPSNCVLERAVIEHCDSIAFDDLLSGDILLFRLKCEPQHVAIFDAGRMIHSYRPIGVVENSFDAAWRERLVGCYRLKGIE